MNFIKTSFTLGLHWLAAIFSDFPELLISSIFYFGTSLLKRADIWLGTAIIALIFILFRNQKEEEIKNNLKESFLFFIILAGFLTTVSIFILSGAGMELSGYQSRVSTSTWFALSLLIAFGGYKLSSTKFYWAISAFLIIIFMTFMAQRDSYIQSYKLQLAIADDVILKMKEIGAPAGAIVLGNVPLYLEKNFNNEEVFSQPWDFGNALYIRSGGYIEGGNTLQYSLMDRPGPKYVEITDDSLIRDGWWKVEKKDFDKLYYYEYNQKNAESKLVKIQDINHLKNIIQKVKDEAINDVRARTFYSDTMLKQWIKNFLQIFNKNI